MKKWMVLVVLVLLAVVVTWRNVAGGGAGVYWDHGADGVRSENGPHSGELLKAAKTRSHVREEKKEKSFEDWAQEYSMFIPPVLSMSEVDAYFAKHGRTPKTLVVVAQLQGDVSLLWEAYEMDPDDEMVWYCLLGQWNLEKDKKEELVSCILEQHPDSGLAWWHMASLVSGSREPDNYKEALVNAGTCGVGNEIVQKQIKNKAALVEALRGFGFTGARLGICVDKAAVFPPLNLTKWPTAEPSQDRAAMFQVGNQISGYSGASWADSLLGNAMAEAALESMPDDYLLDGKMTVAEWKVVQQEKERKFDELQASFVAIQNWPLSQMNSYYEKVMQSGTLAAMQWAVEEFGDGSDGGE